MSLDPRLHKVYTLKALDFNLDYRDLCVEQFKTFLTQLTAEVCDPAAEGVVIIPHMR